MPPRPRAPPGETPASADRAPFRAPGKPVSYTHLDVYKRQDKDREIRQTLTEVYDALKEKGYNPINQLVGYILSEDPTYITTYGGARSKIRKIDRDDLLAALLKNFLGE